MHRVSDLGRRKPLGSGDRGARLGHAQPGDSLRVETVRAASVKRERAVGEAANAEGGRLGNRAERRELRRDPRRGAFDRGEELELGRRAFIGLRRPVIAPVDAQENPGPLPLELDGLTRFEVGLEAVEDPPDRRLGVAGRGRVDGSGHDQPVDRARHRDVIEAARLGLVGGALCLPQFVEARGGMPLARGGIDDLEPHAPVREAQNLIA